MKTALQIFSSAVLLISILGLPVVLSASQPPGSESSTGVSIRTHQWMDTGNYYLGVILNGVNPDQVMLRADGHSLSLQASSSIEKRGPGGRSMSSGSANVSTSLPRDADVARIRKVITGRDFVIVIPREQ